MITFVRKEAKYFTLKWKLWNKLFEVALLCIFIGIVFIYFSIIGSLTSPEIEKIASIILLFLCLLVIVFIDPLFTQHYALRIIKTISQINLHPDSIPVEISVRPRLCKVIEHMLNKSDDIGLLTIDKDQVRFTGDSIQFSIPFSCIKEIRNNILILFGCRIGGARIELILSAGEPIQTVWLDSCSGKTFWSNTAVANHLAGTLVRHLKEWCVTNNIPENQRPKLPTGLYRLE